MKTRPFFKEINTSYKQPTEEEIVQLLIEMIESSTKKLKSLRDGLEKHIKFATNPVNYKSEEEHVRREVKESCIKVRNLPQQIKDVEEDIEKWKGELNSMLSLGLSVGN